MIVKMGVIDRKKKKSVIANFILLQIVGVESDDAGEYVCLADNGRGVPADARVTLTVDPPRSGQ